MLTGLKPVLYDGGHGAISMSGVPSLMGNNDEELVEQFRLLLRATREKMLTQKETVG